MTSPNMTASHYPLLHEIHQPRDLRRLPESRLVPLARELRSFVVHSVAASGGHFAANLGTVELTVALHYVLDTPHDRLVWDVGHQSYPHKILTGRRDRMPTIRRWEGLAPFPKRAESPYDTFGVGHSSTSISAAVGMYCAGRVEGVRRRYVAVIGDGAMTAGLAYEAMDHAGDLSADVLIVLNDNEMSISPNVGGIAQSLTRILSHPAVAHLRAEGKRVLSAVPPVWELARRTRDQVKHMIVPGALFEELGVAYYGPVDGHDLPALVEVLRNLRDIPGPRLLHVVTRKGKGYAKAEANPVTYHGVKPFDPAVGLSSGASARPAAPTFTQVFGDWLCDMAARDPRLLAITPAMREGSGLVAFSERFPKRYFDVGIAEQHAVTLAAGMACDEARPVVAIYSTFLQRAYDQLIHDVALQKLPVLFAIDRAGVVGADGPTHGGTFDLSFLRCIPHMVVMAPADERECRQMLTTGFHHAGPAAVRYPRGKGPGVAPGADFDTLPIGRGECRRRGRGGVALLAFGVVLAECLEVAEGLDATVANMRFIKPLDRDLVLDLASRHTLLVTVEDNTVLGGAGSAVSELLAAAGVLVPVLHLGLPDRFIEHGERGEQLADAGLTPAAIRRAIDAYRERLAAQAELGRPGVQRRSA